ncbi:hypothetical protein [Curvivirga sp.]|uniref:hypothetical protein n=1 Tax=Curvivirga sp. TaxID=2856848 RepID=UPI003B5CBB22
MNLNEKANQLFTLLTELTEVLEQENLLLDQPNSKELGPIVTRKQELLADYEHELGQLAVTPHFFQTLNEEMKGKLRALSKRYQDAALTNERKLRLATRSSQMIADRIKDEARKAAGTQVRGYGQTGGYAQNGAAPRAAPIAINQTL